MRLLAVLLFSVSVFGQATYRHNGPAAENDLAFTPGSIRTTDVKAICETRTGTLRHVHARDQRQAFINYGIDCATVRCGQLWETDHLVSLEAGGDNSLKNLWPQPYTPPGARQKDILENKLRKMICDGQITPADAQHQIATDWYSAYKRYVHPSDVKLGR